MWAAIAYRRAQALALLALSALITACAVFAPLYERSLEQSLLRDGLTRQSVGDTAVVAASVNTRDVPPSAATTRSTFPAPLAPLYDAGSEMWTGQLRYSGVAKQQSTVAIVGPQDVCRSLTLVQGVCPAQPFEVAVSAAEAKVQGWQLGTRLTAVEDIPAVSNPPPFPKPFVVTAFFTQQDDPGHWMGIALEGRAGTAKLDPSGTPLMDGWVTPPATFQGWKTQRLTVAWLLNRDAVGLGTLDAIPAGVDTMRAAGLTAVPTVSVRSNVSDLVTSVVEGQRQARTIVPLLIGQLAVLAVVVLGLAAGAAVEQRRPELALGRLRGRGPGGAARMVMLELGVVVAAGVPVGFALALAMNEAARRIWLAPGVPFEVPTSTYAAALLALLAALAAVALAARPTLREPISTLLRRVPPRRHGLAVGIGDTIVVALAVAGIVTLASGNLAGPLALATPTLLALAVGLVLAHVLVPLANLAARRLTRGGHLVGSLTAVQVSRRPAVRRILAIITVATALTVFATDALVVGARNREDRARVETGAEVVLTTTAQDVGVLRDAVRAADPSGAVATPVVTVHQGSPSAMTTLAVDPVPFSRIAQLPRDASAFAFGSIDRAPPAEVIVNGRTLVVTVNASQLLLSVPQGDPPAELQPTLVAYVAPVGGAAFAVPLGVLTAGAAAPQTFTRDVSCTAGCRVAGFGLTTPAGFDGLLKGRLAVGPLSVDGGAAAAIGDPTLWLPTGTPDAPESDNPTYAKPVDLSSTTTIGIQLRTFRDDVRISSTGVAASVPALVLGPLPSDAPGPGFQAAGLDGTTVDMSQVGSVPYAPGGGTDEAIVSIEALAKRSTQISPLATAQVYVADPTRVAAIQSGLRAAGVDVRSVSSRADREQLFDSSASAWGLRLALVVGIGALAIAALVLVLVAATSWRGRSRDFAALRMAGMSTRSLARVGLAEQWTTIVVSVVAGAVCGLVGAQLAMPIVPFFTVPSTVLAVDLTPATGPALLAAAVALVGLLLVGAVVGTRLVRRATLARVRDQL